MSIRQLHSQTLAAPAIPVRKTVAPGQLLIAGHWRDAASGETMTTSDPTTEAVITTVAKASVEEASDAVGAAHDAFENGRWRGMSHEAHAKDPDPNGRSDG